MTTSSPANATLRPSRSWPAPAPGPRSPSCSTPWRARSSSPVTTPACSRPCWPHRPDRRPDQRAHRGDQELLAPYEEQLQQAESMPWWARSAEDAVAETGVDRPGSPPAVTWCPGRRAPLTSSPASAKARPGTRRATPTSRRPRETAICARTQTREAPVPQARPQPRKNKPASRSQHPAEGLSQAPVEPRMRYEDLGPDYYERQAATRRKISRSPSEAESFEVTLAAPPTRAGPRRQPRTHSPRCLTHTAPHNPNALPDPAAPARQPQPRSAAAAPAPAGLYFGSVAQPGQLVGLRDRTGSRLSAPLLQPSRRSVPEG